MYQNRFHSPYHLLKIFEIDKNVSISIGSKVGSISGIKMDISFASKIE